MSEELPKVSIHGSRLRVDINLALIVAGIVACLSLVLSYADSHYRTLNDARYVQREQYDKDQRNISDELKEIKQDIKAILYNVKPFRTASVELRHDAQP